VSHNTSQRRRILLSIIKTRTITTQEQLVAALIERGVDASQASVSRDIASLGLVKIDGAYARPKSGPQRAGDPRENRIREHLLEVRSAHATVVLLTPPGEANGVALALDGLAWSDVVGTLAGDDTIFVATPSPAAAKRLALRLRKVLR